MSMGEGQAITIVSSGESPGMYKIAKNVSEILEKNPLLKDRVHFCEIKYTTFANGEYKAQSRESVRESKVLLFHPMQQPDPNKSLVQLVMTIDSLKRAAASDITLILPYISYMRQDRKDEPRTNIATRLVADVIAAAGAEKVLTLEPHTEQMQGLYTVFDVLPGRLAYEEDIIQRYEGNLENLIAVSPDRGGIPRIIDLTKSIQRKTGKYVPFGFCNKRRAPGPNQVATIDYVGTDPVDGKDVIIVDDMLDTCDTICKTAGELRKRGAKSVHVYGTHALMSPNGNGPAEDKLRQADLHVTVTNTIPREEHYLKENNSWLTVMPIDSLIAQAIEKSLLGGSIQELIHGRKN